MESGWGDIRFEQIGSSVNGAMGNYCARRSRVSGLLRLEFRGTFTTRLC